MCSCVAAAVNLQSNKDISLESLLVIEKKKKEAILIGLFLFVVINYSKPSGLNCGLWIISFQSFITLKLNLKKKKEERKFYFQPL